MTTGGAGGGSALRHRPGLVASIRRNQTDCSTPAATGVPCASSAWTKCWRAETSAQAAAVTAGSSSTPLPISMLARVPVHPAMRSSAVTVKETRACPQKSPTSALSVGGTSDAPPSGARAPVCATGRRASIAAGAGRPKPTE